MITIPEIKGGTELDTMHIPTDRACTDGQGVLPACAPLANPYVPFQQSGSSTYQAAKALARGTLYPGLDLPFMDMINQNEPSQTALHQLQAMNFSVSELGLYLDTHPEDAEATALFNQYVERYGDALQQYEQQYGSTTQFGAALSGRYQWLHDPWPWEYSANQEG